MKKNIGRLTIITLTSLTILSACSQTEEKEDKKSQGIPQVINITSSKPKFQQWIRHWLPIQHLP